MGEVRENKIQSTLAVFIYTVIVAAIYFYTTLHDLMWINFELNLLKCGHFSIIQALM